MDEESVLSWNMSPSGSLCQEKHLRRGVQPSPRSLARVMLQQAPEAEWTACLNSMGGMSLHSLSFLRHGLRGDFDLPGVFGMAPDSQPQGSLS